MLMMKKVVCLFFILDLAIIILYRKKKDNRVGGERMVTLMEKEINVVAEIADVADWFLLKENMSNKKIQKLCYYAEAWSQAKLDSPIATNSVFEAWVHGPVNKELYKRFKNYGWKKLKIVDEDIEPVTDRLDKIFCEEQKEILEAVWETYGHFSADELESLTHREKPWLEKRVDLATFETSHEKIDVDTMKSYYRSIAIE